MEGPGGGGGAPHAREPGGPPPRATGLPFAILLTLPWIACFAAGIRPAPPLQALLSGLSIFGAAYILSWAAELAQLEMSQALALALLALIAVLPEYSVDMVFAWGGGREDRGGQPAIVRDGVAEVPRGCVRRLGWAAAPAGLARYRIGRPEDDERLVPHDRGTLSVDGLYTAPVNARKNMEVWARALDKDGGVVSLFRIRLVDPQREMALANMTGANRLLIGVGWAAVVFAFLFRAGGRGISLAPSRRLEIKALGVATVYCFALPLKQTLHVYDAGVLLLIFAWYARAASKAGVEEPELEGTAAAIARLPRGTRRLATALMFLWAGGAIFVAAEPFAHGLVDTGKLLGVDEFLLVQWLAPLASEAPEFIVAIRFAWGRDADAGLGCLLSSKVNQWTLLVGMLPLTYMLSRGAVHPLHFGDLQSEEVLLTAAQSLFAVLVLADLEFSRLDALLLFVLFAAQLASSLFHDALGMSLLEARLYFSYAYFAASGLRLLVPSTWRGLAALFRPAPAA